MWMHAQQQPFQYNSGRTSLNDLKEPKDAHTHSPSKYRRAAALSGAHVQSPPPFYGTLSPKGFQLPSNQWSSDTPGEPIWVRQEPQIVGDPFGDTYIIDHHRGPRSSQSDITMPDYQSSSSGSSRATSGYSGVSYEHSKQPSISGVLNEDQYSRVFRNFTPPREPLSTPNFAPIGYKSSAAGVRQVQSASRQLPSVMKNVSLSGIRDISGHSNKSVITDPFQSVAGSETTEQFYASPEVQSKTRQTSLVQGEKDNFETPRKGCDRFEQTPTKTPLHTSASLESVL